MAKPAKKVGERATTKEERTKPSNPSSTNRQLSKSSYFRLRLDHTLRHTQQSTRHIYLVNGAILAMFYFVANSVAFENMRKPIEISLLLLLAGLNILHAGFIEIQGAWYRLFDGHLADAVGLKKPPALDFDWIPPRLKPIVGTHHVYAIIHGVIATALLLAAIFFAYS